MARPYMVDFSDGMILIIVGTFHETSLHGCLVGTMCISSLHGISMVMIALFFLKLIPPTPLEGGESPCVPLTKGEMFPPLGGCP